MIKYSEEKCADVFDEITPLLERHWEEIALNKEKVKLNPDWDLYSKMNEMGLVRTFIARDNGKLIGYFVVTVHPHMHYKDTIYALNDVIYVDPEYRGSTVAVRLIKHVEKEL